jgi:hypothetical protein
VKETGLAELRTLIAALGRSVTAPSRLYLVSRTSHLAEGWCDRVSAFELAGDADRAELGEAVREAGRALGVDVVWESPVDVIPLPAGWEERCRPTAIGPGDTGNALDLRHFDPYSVVLRLIARGDEPDYVAALQYVLHGWVEPARLERLLGEVVPRMTSQTPSSAASSRDSGSSTCEATRCTAPAERVQARQCRGRDRGADGSISTRLNRCLRA